MSLVVNLNALMSQHKINRAELARGSGVPYTTIVALFEKGADNVKLSTLRKLAAYFDVTLDDLAGLEDSDEMNDFDKSAKWSEEEILTLAAHRVGHEGELSEKDMEQVKLALKIALANSNNKQ